MVGPHFKSSAHTLVKAAVKTGVTRDAHQNAEGRLPSEDLN